jgi:hypothetical protein
MKLHQGWMWRLALRCLLAVVFAGASNVVLAADPPDQVLTAPCRELPKCCRSHVYIFLIHGMDPFDFARLNSVNKYFHQLGFNNTYYGQLYHTGYFKKAIRRIHQEDPEGRFVLVGFSFGANMVKSLAQAAKGDGIAIDLLVYLGGNTLENVPEDRPDNVGQIVNILASGCIWNGAWMDGAINIHETDVWHFGSPTHPRTLEVLSQELARVASSVPVPQTEALKSVMAIPEEPTPRPSTASTAAKRDDWDFLKPVSRIKVSPERVPESGSPAPVLPEDKPSPKNKVAGRIS